MHSPPLRRVLIANRGEVALRIIRACRDAHVETVIAYSEADRDSLPVRLADHAVCVGGAAPQASYLQVDRILAAAVGTRCDAIHPGWGFLAEDPELALACEEEGITFIGPRSETIRLLGDKIAARKTAEITRTPIIPGSPARLTVAAETAHLVQTVGYPFLIKAGGGGGGRGLRLVRHAGELEPAMRASSAEAMAAFGNDAIYLERFISHARHIEVQIAGDGLGNATHFGERDCSLQRKYQKLVEEAPSPAVTPELRTEIAAAALRLVSHVRYRGVGTVEFLLDQDTCEFFFIEMNTRLQVEHPVTELVTGHDLVALQLELANASASGSPLDGGQHEIHADRHAIEFRINAEDPTEAFAPHAGTVRRWRPPHGPWIRVDSHCFEGYAVPPYYDSLLAKLIVTGRTREETLRRAKRALEEFEIEGISTTIPLHRWLLEQDDFLEGRIHTTWLEQHWLGADRS